MKRINSWPPTIARVLKLFIYLIFSHLNRHPVSFIDHLFSRFLPPYGTNFVIFQSLSDVSYSDRCRAKISSVQKNCLNSEKKCEHNSSKCGKKFQTLTIFPVVIHQRSVWKTYSQMWMEPCLLDSPNDKIKELPTVASFKTKIKTLMGKICNCKICK